MSGRVPADRAPAVRATGLSRRYGEGNTLVMALRSATFELYPGEVVALLGPSGSGKSTLLTILGLINPPTTGSIEIDGELVISDGVAVANANLIRRRKLGFVFQRSNLIPFLTAEENVRIALELDDVPRREARRRAHEIMETLGVADRAASFPNHLSGGQQQRVAIARALVHKPSLLLADEPTASLDKSLGRRVMELLREAAEVRGAAVLVVTHDHRALDLMHRVFEIEDGVLQTDVRVDGRGDYGTVNTATGNSAQ